MTARVLETVLTGRNLLSPVLATAARDVSAYSSTVTAAQGKAAAATQTAGTTQARAATTAATASTTGSATQAAAANKIAASNVKASTSAQASAATQARAHTQAAQSATVASRTQLAANDALIRSNGLLVGSLTPLTAGLGGVALGLGYAGYRGMEFDAAMSQVQAASQASAADMDRLRAAAIDAGAGTKYSAEEAAQGVTELSKAGVSTADILGGGLTGALNLAAAGEMEVADAAETAATALSVFQLSGDKAEHVADLLAAGAGKAQGSVHDLSMALNQSALVASQAGLSIEDTTGALAMFASNGLLGSDAGTSFKTMLQALTPNSAAAARAMEAIGFSAYDAQGNFVGLQSVAGQLREGLAGLTEEQRAQTLETIFGSDAVRAASVLYKEGADGVATWAANVNDAGYAQRQASQLTDNLKGDLERLGGAFDSAMTDIGAGTQGTLRALVQALTGIVEVGGDVVGFWNSLPGPVQAGVLALAGVAALKGPVSSAFETIALRAMYARDSIAGASVSAAGFRTAGAGLVGFFGGPWGLAFAGAVAGVSLLSSVLGGSSRNSDAAAASAANLTSALEQTKGAIDDTVRSAAVKDLQDNDLLEWAEKTGVGIDTMVDALLGVPDAAAEVGGAFDRYINAQRDDFVDSTGAIVTGFTEQGFAARDARDSFDELTGKTGDTITRQEELAAATQAAGSAVQTAATQVRDFGAEADEANKAVDALKAGLDALSGTTVTMLEAEMQLGAALASAAGALENKHGAVLNADGSLNAYSESGRAASDVLLDIRNSGNQLIATMKQQGSTEDEVRAADARLRQSFIDTAMKMGISSEAANRLADDILGIPSERETRITADTGQATGAVSGLQAQIDGLRGKTVTVKVVTDRAALATYAAQNGMQTVGGYASGGYTGPGGKYDPAGIVHRGEVVWSQADVAAHGGPQRVDEMRRYRGYADGGIVVQGDSSDLRGGIQALTNAMERSLVAGGTAGSGAVTGAWGSLWQLVKRQIPQARINSTYRAGDPGYHGRGKAIDFGYGTGPGGAGSAGLASINRLLHDQVGANLAELIYNGIGDDRPNLKNGQPLAYSPAVQAQHRNHVHAAVRDEGGMVPSGTAAFNLSGRDERMLSPRQTEAFERWMNSPAAMPGYGMGGGNGAGGGSVTVTSGPVHVYLDGQEWRGMARVEAQTVVAGRDAQLARDVRSAL